MSPKHRKHTSFVYSIQILSIRQWPIQGNSPDFDKDLEINYWLLLIPGTTQSVSQPGTKAKLCHKPNWKLYYFPINWVMIVIAPGQQQARRRRSSRDCKCNFFVDVLNERTDIKFQLNLWQTITNVITSVNRKHTAGGDNYLSLSYCA